MKFTKGKYPNNLRRQRKAMGLSYKQVAQLLNIKNQAVISQWEAGIVMPSGNNILKMVFLYRTEASQLFSEYYEEVRGEMKQKVQKQRICLEKMTSSVRSMKR